MEESAAADLVDELLILAPPLRRKNCPDVTSRTLTAFVVYALLFIHCRKGSEIMLALDHRRGLLHGVFIQWIRIVPDVVGEKGRTDRFAVNPVAIGLRLRRLA